MIGIVFISFFIGLAQNSIFNPDQLRWKEFSFNFQDNFKDSLALWPERVSIQIANKISNGNDPIFFKAYLSSDHQSTINGKSRVLNLELLDDKGALVKRQFHKITGGTAEGHLDLPKKIAPGNYSVKAYTRWSQNYGTDFVAWENIQIGDGDVDRGKVKPSSQISVVPEGGTLLIDYKNRIIVQAPKNQNGIGRIVTKNRKEVAEVSFYSAGVGTAIFKPMEGEEYYLELADGTRSPVPKAKKEGYLLHANNLDEHKAKIRVTSSSPKQELTLIGESGGLLYFKKKLNFDNENTLDITLSKTDFPDGIFHLKLVDDLGTEWAHRPMWIKEQKLQIDISPIDSGEKEDSKIYKIRVTDSYNNPVKAKLAFSANQYGKTSEGNEAAEILEKNNLFAFSEADKLSNRKESFLEDLSLISSKTRTEITSSGEENESTIKFQFQEGLEIIGSAYDLNGNLLSDTKVQVFAKSDKEIWLEETVTDSEGILKLENIHIDGKATLVARTKGDDINSMLVKIVPFDRMQRNNNVIVPYVAKNDEKVGFSQLRNIESFDSEDSEKVIELEEVQVTENAVKRKKMSPSVYGMEVPSSRIKFQDFESPKSLPQLLSELPGVMVRGFGTLNVSASIIGAAGPILWVLDGFPMSQQTAHLGANSEGNLNEVMFLINSVDIERVELFRGADAAIFGARGSGGAIAIYTRRGNEMEQFSTKESEMVFEGYTPKLDFNTYKNGLSKRREIKMNLLYWNPDLQTDMNGEAVISVPTPQDISKIRVDVSAISKDGKIASANRVFSMPLNQ